MERYYQILARSLAAGGRTDPEARLALYASVRGQIDKLIDSARPPMPQARIIAEKSALEQAIVRMEAEYRASPGVGTQLEAGPANARNAAMRASPYGAPQREPPLAGPAPAPAMPQGRATRQPRDGTPPKQPRSAPPPPRRKLRLPATWLIIAGVAVVIASALAAALYAVSVVYAPEIPSMAAVNRSLQRDSRAVLFVGAVPERVTPSPDAIVSASNELFGQGSVRITSRNDSARPFGRNNAAQIELTPAIREALVGKTLRVTMVVRGAPGSQSPQMALAVTDGGRRTTGWRRFALGGDYRPYALDFTFEETDARRRPVIAIWADTEGAGRGIEIREVRLAIVPNPEPAAEGSEPVARAAPADVPRTGGTDLQDSADEGE